jgi:16S rRNA (cytidine1402-2'-O)-methyltransferase
LGDITLRVLDALKEADLVAAEDTRRTRKLLSHYKISKPLVSFFEHNELKRLPQLLKRLRQGEVVALVSDAGMPGICDPGYRLIKAALDEGLPVEVLPGPSAIETALVASGFTTDSFIFLGFLPRKKRELREKLKQIAAEPRTCVAFESPRRLKTTLEEAAATLGERQVAVCRELTKKFEEIQRGSAFELAALLPEKIKGEIVLVFAEATQTAAGVDAATLKLKDAICKMMTAGLSARQSAEIASLLSGTSRRKTYQTALGVKKTLST